MSRSTTLRLAAGTLALALPLAAAAGCGAQKKKTVAAEFASASSNLMDSKAMSFTLRLDDAKGNAAKLAKKEGDVPSALVDALLTSTITYTADPVGDKTFKSIQPSATSTDLSKSLKDVNIAFVVRDAKAELLELRVVAGDLYAHVNLAEISRLSGEAGQKDFDGMLDESIGQMGPTFAQGLTDVRAGKWLKLPLAKYLDQLQDLAKGFDYMAEGATPGTGYDASALGKKLYAAVKPYVKVTDANDSSSDRVLDVNVQARPAVKALLAVLKAEKELPFAGMLGAVTPAEVDKHLANGNAHGTIRLKDSHLTQVALDIESLRLLSTDPGTDSLAGVQVVIDVDDDATALTVPTNVSSLDLGAILDEFLQGMTGMPGVALQS